MMTDIVSAFRIFQFSFYPVSFYQVYHTYCVNVAFSLSCGYKAQFVFKGGGYLGSSHKGILPLTGSEHTTESKTDGAVHLCIHHFMAQAARRFSAWPTD